MYAVSRTKDQGHRYQLIDEIKTNRIKLFWVMKFNDGSIWSIELINYTSITIVILFYTQCCITYCTYIGWYKKNCAVYKNIMPSMMVNIRNNRIKYAVNYMEFRVSRHITHKDKKISRQRLNSKYLRIIFQFLLSLNILISHIIGLLKYSNPCVFGHNRRYGTTASTQNNHDHHPHESIVIPKDYSSESESCDGITVSAAASIPANLNDLRLFEQKYDQQMKHAYHYQYRFKCSLKPYFIIFILFISMLLPKTMCSTHNNINYSMNIIKTKYGPLRGIILRSNPTVEGYLGVPYATPPTGSLRYMPPVTPSSWQSVRLADRFGAVCPQPKPLNIRYPGTSTEREQSFQIPQERYIQLKRLLPLLSNQSEDCLYLNLYVPRIDNGLKRNSSLSTVLFIHGESYEWNSGNPYDGTVLAAHGNIIVATINFRLGVLGFLKTGAKGSAQGNFGLMDLIAGLHWLHENLPSFGGDPTKISVMGHGTGAALANILIVSPVSSDLISRAILLSGSALSPWAIQSDPLYVKSRVAEQTGCQVNIQEDDIAPCLRTRPISALLNITLDVPRFLPGFAPFIDGTVLLNSTSMESKPITLPIGSALTTTSGSELADFPMKELLFGLTSIESYLDLNAQDLIFGFNETKRDRILRTFVRNIYQYHLNEIFSIIKNEYTDWERSPPRTPIGIRDATLQFLSDGHTASSLVRLGYLHSIRGGRSYSIHFKHRSSERGYPQQTESLRGEDVPFYLGYPISSMNYQNYTSKDKKLSGIMVQYVSNFIKYGNPNKTPSSNKESDISQLPSHNQIQNRYKRSLVMKRNKMNETVFKIDSKLIRQTGGNRVRLRRYKNIKTKLTYANGNYKRLFNNLDAISINNIRHRRETDDYYSNANWEELIQTELPFWDSYDTINQLYMQLGEKAEIRSHYRGHRLSLWLSLIPQLHSPGDLADLAMRHHHFQEDDAQFYDGIVRQQKIEIQPPSPPVRKKSTTLNPPTTVKKDSLDSVTTATVPTTECAHNLTMSNEVIANQRNYNTNNELNNNLYEKKTRDNNLINRITSNQYQNYTFAFVLTVGAGTVLLLLNIIIFIGIYYQRGKCLRRDRHFKSPDDDEFRNGMISGGVEGDINGDTSSATLADNFSGKDSSRKSSLHEITGIVSNSNLSESKCYDDKRRYSKGNYSFDTDIIIGSIPHHIPRNVGTFERRSSFRRAPSMEYVHSKSCIFSTDPESQMKFNFSQQCLHSKSIPSGLAGHHTFPRQSSVELCSQSTQADEKIFQDVGTTVCEHDVDAATKNINTDTGDPLASYPMHMKSTNVQGTGILRQNGSSPSTSGKKRVHIQEISV